MSVMYFQSRKKSASSHLNLESVSENKYWLCSSVSIEVDKNTRYNKKWLDWMNENLYLVQFKSRNCCEVLMKKYYISFWVFQVDRNKRKSRK